MHGQHKQPKHLRGMSGASSTNSAITLKDFQNQFSVRLYFGRYMLGISKYERSDTLKRGDLLLRDQFIVNHALSGIHFFNDSYTNEFWFSIMDLICIVSRSTCDNTSHVLVRFCFLVNHQINMSPDSNTKIPMQRQT